MITLKRREIMHVGYKAMLISGEGEQYETFLLQKEGITYRKNQKLSFSFAVATEYERCKLTNA